MTKLYVFCSDLNTKKICDKYSDNGLIYQDEEFQGNLNFKSKQQFIDFLADVGENLESNNYPFPKFPDLQWFDEDEFWEYWNELRD
jgi:hypothetical protein